jgi:nucleolar protein 56
MTREPVRSVVTTWFGAFLFEGDALLRSAPFPTGDAELLERLRLRRDGRLAPEELDLLARREGQKWSSRDRRFAPHGILFEPTLDPPLDPTDFGVRPESLRRLLLDQAARDLTESWDPTVHVQEAIRALGELDELLNGLGERLTTWTEHDRPVGHDEGTGHRTLARELTEERSRPGHDVPGADPALARARRELAVLYLAADRTHAELERALEEVMPLRAPNLTALLGPVLAARMISQAGNLDRLARLPASTIQVLGAERAFFEHLRGRAPPPRHGLLFLHPKLHSAPRAQRGRLARALAGKVAIAARLDRAGRPLDPALGTVFESRAKEIARPRKTGRSPEQRRDRSVAPLHRAAQDR